MKINFSKLLDGHEKSIKINQKISNFIDDININNGILIKGNLTISNNVLNIHLNVSCQLEMICSRCLSPFVYPMSVEIIEKVDLDKHKEEIHGDIINITELIRENILINLPIKPMCKDDCLGLCQYCGNNRNIEACNCDKEQVDPRLSVLNNIFNGDE